MLKLEFALERFRKILNRTQGVVEEESRKAISAHCSQKFADECGIRYDRNVIFISTNNSVFRAEILLKKNKILEHLKEALKYNHPRDIRFSVPRDRKTV